MNCTYFGVYTVAGARRGGNATSISWPWNGLNVLRKNSPRCRVFKVNVLAKGRKEAIRSAWDDEPFEILPSGKIVHLDVQDIVTILEPPKELIPLDPASYNPATYVWKKIGDIPEARRHQLLLLLKPRLVSRLWAVAGSRFDDPKLMKKSASSLTSMQDAEWSREFWTCQKSLGPFPISWVNNFKKVLFRGQDGAIYGRLFLGDTVLGRAASSFSPLYFSVKEVSEVMATEQPCDLAYDFGDGLLDPANVPEGFPVPVSHRQPFADQLVVYIRHAGPGVMVGQAWQEGKELEQVPKKFCGEILMPSILDQTAP
ncbi:WD repeat protein isoform X2 [Wolffia australiana]